MESNAVIVWELRGLVEDVHCFFEPRRSEYRLSIERAGELLLEERHDDFGEMMGRARELRSCLVRVGFEPVSEHAATPPIDSLLLNFVRVGTLSGLGHRPS
jgi:hypothetical protein